MGSLAFQSKQAGKLPSIKSRRYVKQIQIEMVALDICSFHIFKLVGMKPYKYTTYKLDVPCSFQGWKRRTLAKVKSPVLPGHSFVLN